MLSCTGSSRSPRYLRWEVIWRLRPKVRGKVGGRCQLGVQTWSCPNVVIHAFPSCLVTLKMLLQTRKQNLYCQIKGEPVHANPCFINLQIFIVVQGNYEIEETYLDELLWAVKWCPWFPECTHQEAPNALGLWWLPRKERDSWKFNIHPVKLFYCLKVEVLLVGFLT